MEGGFVGVHKGFGFRVQGSGFRVKGCLQLGGGGFKGVSIRS